MNTGRSASGSPLRRRLAAAGAALACVVAFGLALTAQDPPAAERTLRIIVVGSVAEADAVLTRLRAGDDFAALARQQSIDPSAAQGGWLGRLAVSGLRPELREAVERLSVGEVSAAVRIPTGVAVLRVESNAAPPVVSGIAPGLASSGAVKYVLDVGGFSEAALALSQFDKPAGWNLDPQSICTVRRQSLDVAETALARDLLSPSSPLAAADPVDATQALYVLAQIYSYSGKMERAVDVFERAAAIARTNRLDVAPQFDEALGVAYLHKAAMDEGLFTTPGDRCLLPRSGAVAARPSAGLEKAIGYFTRSLADHPSDLEVKWLLNVSHMMAGSYPGGVPAEASIPATAFASGDDVGRFRDVAAAAGLTSFGAAGGVVVDDFDGDGRFDVVTSTSDPCGPLRLFHRTARGPFEDRSQAAGFGGQMGGLNAMQADYDNDGRLDLLVLRGGWGTPERKSLLHNTGNGTFTDVTVASGLSIPTATQTAVWADVNRDGFLDLFVGNEQAPAQLFVNRTNGTFEDVATRAGVNRSAFAKAVTAGDYDNDGWTDLYVSNVGGPNFLYHNERNGTFSERAAAAGVPGPELSFASWFFDYDNDGWQDLFVTSYYTSVEETARTYLRMPLNAPTLKLYRNKGDGTFADVTAAVGLEKVYMPMGANFGDIDNDGFLDIYLGTGNPSYAAVVPSVLLRNREGRAFVDVTASSGTGELHKGHGVAFADLDGDGDQEIVFEVGGATPGDAHALRLFENPGHGNGWLGLKLTGVRTNRAAIGARVTVTVRASDGTRRTLHRTVGSGGSFGASPLQQHIGLGPNIASADVDIWWPLSNTRQRFQNVAANQVIAVREDATAFVRVDAPRLALRGAAR